MSDEIVFGPGEAEAWRRFAERVDPACGHRHAADYADALLLELRKRTAPQAQGEDGLPEGWWTDPMDGRVSRKDDRGWVYEYSGGWGVNGAGKALFHDNDIYSTRAAAIAAVEAHLRGGE